MTELRCHVVKIADWDSAAVLTAEIFDVARGRLKKLLPRR